MHGAVDGNPSQRIQKTFLWVGNNGALDFINTAIMAEGEPVDLLDCGEDCLDWLKEAFGVGGSAPRTLLTEARQYRAALRRGIERLEGGPAIPGALIEETNAYLSRGAAWRRLARRGGGYALETARRLETASDFLVPVAESFASLVSEADVKRIRKCANPECVLHFLDTSKGGRRTWCSLDICGNKLRMAASRKRRGLVPGVLKSS
jgi:predicted RNA-binding Zn ribbon-like protein